MNTNIHKIERALAFAKEVGLNDEQVKELMAMVLGLVNLKFSSIPATPIVPWIPNTTPGYPGIYPGDTIISYGVVPVDTDPNSVTWCACAPRGQPHSDSCKSGDSLFEMHKLHDH